MPESTVKTLTNMVKDGTVTRSLQHSQKRRFQFKKKSFHTKPKQALPMREEGEVVEATPSLGKNAQITPRVVI